MHLPYTKNPKQDCTACSFCGQHEDEAGVLISGDQACICPACITKINAILLETAGIQYSTLSQYEKLTRKMGKFFGLVVVLFSLAFFLFILILFFRH
jgi:hypothetical protein